MKKENYKIGDWVYMNDYYDKEQVIGAFFRNNIQQCA